MGCVLQVFFKPEAQLRDWPWEFIDTEFSDFAEACAAIAAGGLIGGERLWTRKSDDQAERVVTKRAPMAFRAEGVVRLELPTVRLVEEV
jgi:hypothetical protein